MEIPYHINDLFNSVSYALKGIIIDPGDKWRGFYNVEKVLLTHAHFDHIYGLNDLLKISPSAKVITNEYGREMLFDAKKNMSFYHETPFVFNFQDSIITVEDGYEIILDSNLTAKAIFTPGHNPSCITWIIEDCLFTGDSYIPRLKTVTNLPGGNKFEAEKSLNMIKSLEIARTVYPGHIV